MILQKGRCLAFLAHGTSQSAKEKIDDICKLMIVDDSLWSASWWSSMPITTFPLAPNNTNFSDLDLIGIGNLVCLNPRVVMFPIQTATCEVYYQVYRPLSNTARGAAAAAAAATSKTRILHMSLMIIGTVIIPDHPRLVHDRPIHTSMILYVHWYMIGTRLVNDHWHWLCHCQ